MKRKLMTTPILDSHGKVGPFFLKEGMVIFLILFFLYFAVILVGTFYPIRSVYLLVVPGSFLLLLTAVRLFLIKKLTSPWYMHDWMARYFIWPKSILANSLPSNRNRTKDEK